MAILILAAAGCNTPSPTVRFEPASWNFGSLAFGGSMTEAVKLTNTSGFPLQVLRAGDSSEIAVSGLPIANLAAGASASLQVTIRPVFNDAQAYQGGFGLLVGGYSGSEWGDVTGNPSFDVDGQFTAVLPRVCDPGPGGESNGFGGVGGEASFDWGQSGYACVGGPTDGGSSCGSALQCASFCCACPNSCAGFTSQACVMGSCAPAAVACDLPRMNGSGPGLCPQGGFPPSSVLGDLGFKVATSSAHLTGSSEDSPIAIALGAGQVGCGALDGGDGILLVLTPPDGGSHDPGLYPVGYPDTGDSTAELDGPDSPFTSTSGYLVLAGIDDAGVAGSFDIFVGRADGAAEIWGTFDAPLCP